MMLVICVTSPPKAALQSGADAADEAQRIDAIADDQFAGAEPLEMQAIDFVARQSGHDRHGLDP